MDVRIYQPAKNAMQSGPRQGDCWRVQFNERAPKFVEPLMGWIGGKDTTQQLNLTFDTLEEAVAYATANHLSYEVIPPKKKRAKAPPYADNFRYNKTTTRYNH